MKFIGSFLLAFIIVFSSSGQSAQSGASEIKLKIKKLNFLGSVLYVAAHPDDENTRAIAYLANERLAATAYLSMTRGDGGQNLIGPEIRDLLGVIRTQELLAARRIDGGHQFFTRANDFGFSKNQLETFQIWGKDTILSDVVRVYRQYQPDVILTRFPPDERAGHGHHTASAVLAQEAFDLSNQSSYQPDQVKAFGLWQSKRLLTNTGRWWNTTINENTPGVITLNVGAYNSLLGESYSEMAAASRTQHKSQGFGSPGRRGDAPEFFEYIKGEPAQKDIFDGINTTWTRIKGGERVKILVDKAIAEFNYETPEASIPLLIQIRKEIAALEPSVWKQRKWNEVTEIIQQCAGLFLEASAGYYFAVPGEKVVSTFEVINRSSAAVTLVSLQSSKLSLDTTMNKPLARNQLGTFKIERTLSGNAGYSDPYWLQAPHPQGYFTVKDKSLIGQPENTPAIIITAKVMIDGELISTEIPVRYKWTDPVKGELYRPVEITPPVFLNLDNSIYIFSNDQPKSIKVTARSNSSGKISPKLSLNVPSGWKVEPGLLSVDLAKREDEVVVSFLVTPPKGEESASIKAVAELNGQTFSHSIRLIQYDHIPVQTLMPVSESKAVRMNIRKEGSVIGYIKGAGDDIPTGLRNMGYEVWEMKNEEVTAENLKKVDAVVLGVRTLNTNERIRNVMPELLTYVKNGGTMVVQYNTNGDLEIEANKFSPYPITLGRDRVTEENSEIRILKPEHPLLKSPNPITAKEFEGWVQERGLYFPSAWDPKFDAVISSNDTGEKPKDGSILVTNYGEGYYIYTGISFFRQLPEGVTGAYKLFANMVSLKKPATTKNQKVKTKSK